MLSLPHLFPIRLLSFAYHDLFICISLFIVYRQFIEAAASLPSSKSPAKCLLSSVLTHDYAGKGILRNVVLAHLCCPNTILSQIQHSSYRLGKQ